ncbi:PLxRFG domain-containing protein [Pseudolabrys sp.]|uniref:PLxRFG domain-containing protein n=1 Tax=Pseudolabrys sp. TaxID=1960880 RepID=UPI003D0A9ED7
MASDWVSLDDIAQSSPDTAFEPSALPKEDESPSWSDYGNVAVSSVKSLGAQAMGFGRYINELAGDSTRADYFRAKENNIQAGVDDTLGKLSKPARDRLESSITSGEFWKHPFSAGALKLTGTSAQIASSILPGALVSGTLKATMAVAAAGGAINVGQVVDEFYREVDAIPDDELQKKSDLYRGLRSMYDESDARAEYNTQVLGLKPAINFVVGAAANAIGPAGQIVRGVKGAGASVTGGANIGQRVLAGAAEGAAGGAIQGGVADYSVQSSLVEGGAKPEIDMDRLVSAVLEPSALGGVMGAAAGAAFRGPRARPPKEFPSEEASLRDLASRGRVESPSPDTVNSGTLAPDQEVALRTRETVAPEDLAGMDNPDRRSRQTVAAEDLADDVASRARAEEIPQEVQREQPGVTPEVIGEAPPVQPEQAVPSTAPPVEEPGPVTTKGRVLTSQTDEAKANLKAQNKQLSENVGSLKKIDAPKGKHWTKAQLAKREADHENAKRIFEEHVPEETVFPRNAEEFTLLRDRLQAHIDAAQEAGIKIPTKVGYEGTSGYVVHLREAKDLAKKLSQKGFVGQRRAEQVTSFLAREKSARGGDFSLMRSERRAEGEAAKRVFRGDVEQRADTKPVAEERVASLDEDIPTAPADTFKEEAQDLQAKVPASSRGSARGVEDYVETGHKVKLKEGGTEVVERAKAASPVRKVELTPEERAKYETPGKPKEPAKSPAKEPTEAQKEAGNYQKKHVRVHGLDISIETEKGQKRTGKDASGKTWSVDMRDDYGYVKRTEGADGDQVDVFVGPDHESKHVLVIDQRDLKTGKFDEHKAILGYRDSVEALQAYERGFSDGKGLDRVLSAKEMSVDDFKEWLKSGKTKEQIGDLQPDAMVSWVGDSGPNALYSDVHGDNQVTFTALDHKTSSEVLGKLTFDQLRGIPGKMAPFIRARLMKAAGDVPMMLVDAETIGRLAHSAGLRSGEQPWGLYVPEGKNSRIYISEEAIANNALGHVVLHEVTHAATVERIWDSPQHTAIIRRMMDEVDNYFRMETSVDPDKVYAMRNEREFVAEAFSNPDFQEWLSRIPLSKELASRINMGGRKIVSVWDWFVSSIRSLLGFPPGTHTALEGIIRVGGTIIDGGEGAWQRHPLDPRDVVPQRLVRNQTDALVSDVNEVFKKAVEKSGLKTGSPKLLKLRPMDQIAQTADRFFGPENNPIRKIADLKEMIRVKGDKLLRQSEPVVSKLYQLERKYKGKVWDEFTRLVHDETMSSVFADRDLAVGNAHLGKDTLAGAWSKAQHADLHKRWKELPEDLKQARREAMAFFTNQQNAMSLGIINNRILAALGVNDTALAKRIHEGTITDADRDRVGHHTMDLIMDAKELAKIEGPYFPLMRRGDYAVVGEYKIDAPAKGAKISDNEFEFKSRDDALNWAKSMELRPTVRSVYVDSATGKLHFPDGTKVTSKDIQGEQRFRVEVQNRHVEFFDTAAEAAAASRDYAGSHYFTKVKYEERRFEAPTKRGDIMSYQLTQLMDSLERGKGYQDMTTGQRHELARAMREASIRWLGSTRIQSRRLPRRYVEGASRDLTRNTWDYANSSSAYLAKLEYQPRLESALKDLQERVKNDYTTDGSLGRSALANEVLRRESIEAGQNTNNKFAPAIQRVLTVSFIDKLFSPAYNVINSMQPAMVTAPVLAGRFGVGRAVTELGRAYQDVAAYSVVKQGIRETARKAAAGSGEASIIDTIKGNLRDTRERAMIDYLVERGSIDPESGFEIAQLVKAKDGTLGRIDSGIGYVEGIARQMPRSIEAINRTVTALAAYRMEMSKSGNFDKALRYAQDTVNSTQGLYSASNAAPVFNHPLGKLTLQFRKYSSMILHLLGQQIGKALENRTPGERAEALKTLTMLAGTHIAMAGALGLPTEGFKFLFSGLKFAGVPVPSWDEVEDAVRAGAASAFGKKGGEILSRGLPRAIGIDLSSRVGLDNLLTFGEPKSDAKNDVKAWVFDTIGGAPISLVGDWVVGANALASGDFAKAAELMVPIKFISDTIKAARQLREGKKSSTGRQLSEPYNYAEAAARVLGFTPAREAEEGAKAASFKRQSDALSKERSRLTTEWVTSKGSDKVQAWSKIQEWNRTQNPAARITMKQLTSAAKKKLKEPVGINPTKQTKYIKDRLERVY